MITLKIDDPDIEMAYYSDFDGDEKKFIEFISKSCVANNVEVDMDPKLLEKLYLEGVESGDSGLTHEEVWDSLFKKYDKN